ncbi:lipocalin-like domain-containing protein [Sphingomonas immobilis]|uniref:Lipocalin-like domain-containing protein n=1 Tax=Sphingomonas immobilis TaxID=3063997 RepID=A0ABT8ZX90_9SPHN|nr:lipocalin-like domain-containing protein [Sphingomonas sp. CA1-15]MDO7842154.1 lipocalin-like domain-containing protein [Sphingomonas sp. CA1-15]
MIRERLLGAWKLVTFEAWTADGRQYSPMGRAGQGYIVYSPDGHVSVSLSRGDRQADDAGRPIHRLDDAGAAALARSYTAYAGPFEVDEERAVARHHFELSLDPTMIGTLQERHVRFPADDLLELSVKPGASGLDTSTVLWRRA